MIALPIDTVMPAIRDAVRARRGCVVVAAPGAGKTTRVPPALLDLVDGAVLLLEPRRLAARAAARRIAEERGQDVGGEVGWQVRFDRRTTAATRLVAATHGILARRLVGDPLLDGVGAVVFDELHERGLDADVLLAMVRAVRDARPDLVVVAMSATFDPGPVAAFLDVPTVEAAGRMFPVDVRYLDRPDDRPTHAVVAHLVREALNATGGDVLAFLPGAREIRDTAALLDHTGVEVLTLHGSLDGAAQDRALRAASHRRVVLATNVAETSVTVEGVTAVVDSGLARVPETDPGTGLHRLVLRRISAASADQRAGRAGRLGPGVALRAWTARQHLALPEALTPEVRRLDLAGVVLGLRAWGEPDPATFRWFEAPRAESLARAEALLVALGAVADGELTARGAALAALPLHPRLGALLLEAAATGQSALGAKVAALLGDRDPFGPSGPSDLEARANGAFAADGPAGATLRAIARQLERLAPGQGARIHPHRAVARMALAGWPDRIACRRALGAREAVLTGGRGVMLPDDAEPTASLFACVAVEDVGTSARARVVASVEAEDLPIATHVVARFDPERERVVGVCERRYHDLVIDSQEGVQVDDDTAIAALAEAAERDLQRALHLADPDTATLLARLHNLRRWRPELELPAVDDDALRRLVPDLARGARSFAELRGSALRAAVLAQLDHRQRQALDQLAPERMQVPTGRSLPLRWEPDAPPVLAVKMQELFGTAHTPTVCGGAVRVRLHLLAPNGRPQQVTDDLAGFWDRTWGEVRKELRARYPRHAWPEDPRTAKPERK